MAKERSKELEHPQDKGPFSSDAEGNRYYTVKMKKGDGFLTEMIADHTPKVESGEIRTDGCNEHQVIRIRALRNGKWSGLKEMDIKTLLGQTPQAVFGFGYSVMPRCLSWYRLDIQEGCKDLKWLLIHEHTGWIRSDDGRLKAFLNRKYSIDVNGLTDAYTVEPGEGFEHFGFQKVDEPDEVCVHTVWDDLKEILPPDKLVPLLGYIFVTPLNEILRSIGDEPRVTLYIVGQTGTGKTSIAQLLLNCFGSFSYSTSPVSSFKDSPAAIRRKLGIGADMVLLLDDLRPSSNHKEQLRYEEIEKEISSAIGDRTVSGRLNADGSARKTPVPKCNLIVTGETAYQNIAPSGIARSLTIEFKTDTVNAKALKAFEKTAHLNRTMQLFIQWIIQRQDEIKTACPKLLEEFRKDFADTGHARLATSCSHLLLGYSMFLLFIKSLGVIEEKVVNSEISAAKQYLEEMCAFQNKLVEEDSPVKMFLDGIRELLVTKQKKVAVLKEHKVNRLGLEPKDTILGYKDADYYYLIPGTAYSAVFEFYSRGGSYLTANRKTLQDRLLTEHIVIPEKDTKSKDGVRADKRVMVWENDKKTFPRCWTIPARFIDSTDEEVVKDV